MTCDISVIIPNYNRTLPLRRALGSIRDQTVLPAEVIIVDDHSSPANLIEIKSIIEDFSGTFSIILILNDQNRGANYSRNRGIHAANSRYICFLDSDDLWMPKKLELQMAQIERAVMTDSRPVLSGTGRYRVDNNGHILARQFGGTFFSPEKIRRSNFIGTLSSVLVETWIARHTHGFDESLPACQDWDFFIRIADYVQYVGVKESLCVYVDHDEERITLNNMKRLKAHLLIYKRHIKSFTHVEKSPNAEIYRNVAEDYQIIGNAHKADLFYAKYMSLRSNGLSYYLVPRVVRFCFYYSRGAPNLKEKRYAHYKQSMATQCRKPDRRDQITVDADVISQMMHRQDI